MLTASDPDERTDRAIAARVARWTGRPIPEQPPAYSRDRDAARSLRDLMERSGRIGRLRPVSIDQNPAYFYTCVCADGRPFAQGVGTTPPLAICDAFLRCPAEGVEPSENPESMSS